MSLAVGFDLTSCSCKQCRHVTEFRDRCECCVFLLHGKRSAPVGNSVPNHNDSPAEISLIRPKRKHSSYILDVINPFGAQRDVSQPKNEKVSFDTLNLPRHLNALMIMENRRRALDTSNIDDDANNDLGGEDRYRYSFGYRLKAMEPLYFQYKPMAKNQIQSVDELNIKPLDRFSSSYDFVNGDDYTDDYFDTKDVVDVVQPRSDSNGPY